MSVRENLRSIFLLMS